MTKAKQKTTIKLKRCANCGTSFVEIETLLEYSAKSRGFEPKKQPLYADTRCRAVCLNENCGMSTKWGTPEEVEKIWNKRVKSDRSRTIFDVDI